MGDREGGSGGGEGNSSGGLKRKVHLQSPAGEASPVINPRPAEIDDRKIGRYHVVGEITQGSKSSILKARDTDLGRDVAMKVLKREFLSDPEAIQRFVEEAQVGAQLQHPGILPVYELGLVADNRPYFTMKFERGETLAILLASREKPTDDQRRFLGIFEKVCHAIAYAHTRTVIHRDLRPWNVMVGDYGDVVVMDWGLAKVGALSGEPAMSRSATDSQVSIIETIRQSENEPDLVGVMIGTPGYMSPEQASGDVNRMDERSDVFALGAILCEILTGAAPYQGDRVDEILKKAMFADQKDATERLDRCGADPRLVKLTKACLTPARDARPRNADDVASALGKILTLQEAEARRAQVDAEEEKIRARGAAKARRLTYAIAGSVLLAGVLAAGLVFWLDRAERTERDQATGQVLAALGAALDQRRVAETMAAGRPERWVDALAAANAARDLAEASPVDQALRQRTRALAAEIGRIEAEDRALADAENRRRRLVDALTRVRESGWEEPEPGDVPERYERVFAELGISFGEADETEAAAALAGLGVGTEIVGALDDWSRALADRGVRSEENGPLRVVRILDDDPVRNRIRTVVAGSSGGKRRGSLLALASQLGQDLASGTFLLLGSALLGSGTPEAAVAPLRAGAEGDSRDFWSQFQLGTALHRKATPSLTEAIGRFSTAIALRPGSRGARHALAACLTARGTRDEAAAILRDLLEAEPDDGHLTAHLGENLPEEEGRRLIENAATSAPEDPWIRNRLGLALLERGEWSRAAREFAAAIGGAPGWREAHRNWMLALAGAGTLETALARYETATGSSPGPDDRLLLGECLIGLGRPDEALEPLGRAVEQDPGDAEALFALGLAQVARGDGASAVEAFGTALGRRPGYREARRRLALGLAAIGRIDAAIQTIRDGLEETPGDSGLRADLGWLLLRSGAYSGALDALDKARASNSGEPGVEFGRALALIRLGRPEEAEKGLRFEADRAPFRLEKVRQLHRVLRSNRTIETEVKLLARQRSVRPGDTETLLSLSSALLGAGRPDEALEVASAAVRGGSSTAAAHLLRGRALEVLGRLSAAGAAYRQATIADPRHAVAWCRLGLIDLQGGAFADASRHLSIGHRLGTADPSWSLPSGRWLGDARRMEELEPELARVRTGQQKGESAEETLGFAKLLLRKEEPALAARFFRLAWEMGAGTLPEPSDENAWLGARAVALANFPDAERDDWARLVLSWLNQGLVSAGLKQESVEGFVAPGLDRWLFDAVIGRFREPRVLSELPVELEKGFEELWKKAAGLSGVPLDGDGSGGGR